MSSRRVVINHIPVHCEEVEFFNAPGSSGFALSRLLASQIELHLEDRSRNKYGQEKSLRRPCARQDR